MGELPWACRSMVDRKITGLEVAGSNPVMLVFLYYLFHLGDCVGRRPCSWASLEEPPPMRKCWLESRTLTIYLSTWASICMTLLSTSAARLLCSMRPANPFSSQYFTNSSNPRSLSHSRSSTSFFRRLRSTFSQPGWPFSAYSSSRNYSKLRRGIWEAWDIRWDWIRAWF